ncbi:WXG100 family type VII secretion target [Nocardia sienata]|uniref:WXG100 family type VII secretion target n=1 Tax=Nocardia sienata TaxID=248552 RepID=UPI0007A426A6|nr:WXG100 family type VII secretion target [Nocardia sienata]
MPEGSAFQVDLEELDNITARVGNFIGFLSDSLTALDQRMTALHSTWGGEAATAQRDAFQQWAVGATDVAEGIDAMRKAARSAHDRYTAAIETNRLILGR